jgi:hypothetical protein
MTPTKLLFASLLMTTVLMACGNGSDADGNGAGGVGGEGGSGTAGVGGGRGISVPLQVVETDPIDMATDVLPDTAVRATFSDALQEITVSPTSFTVRRSDGRELGGTVTVTSGGDGALFVPDGALALRTAYTATLTTGIENLDGSSLEADYAWVFTTRGDGTWGTAERIDVDDAGDAWEPQVAVDASGNAVAVWVQGNIWSNRWTPGGGWGTAERIEESASSASTFYPQVAIDASGNAVAVWAQGSYEGNDFTIWWNRSTPSGGWGTAERMDTDDDPADGLGNHWGGDYAQVAADASGNVVAVWLQSDGTRFNIWSNRWTPGGTWGAAELIETDDTESAYSPHVAIDASGNAVAVWNQAAWQQTGGLRENTWSNRWTSIDGWGTAELIGVDSADTGNSTHPDPQVAVDASGNAVAVWTQSGTRGNFWSNRWTPRSSWGTAELIGTDDAAVAELPQVAVDANGNAVVVWMHSDGARCSIWSNRWTPGGGWGTAERIEAEDAEDARRPQLAVDASGNAIAVWYQSNGIRGSAGRATVWSNRWTLGGGWGTAERINTEDAHYTHIWFSSLPLSPQVAFDANGSALAVWSQSNGTRNAVWSNRFEKE